MISVDKKLRKSNSQKYMFPNKCPSCGSKTIKEYNSITKKLMQFEDVAMRLGVKKFQLKN